VGSRLNLSRGHIPKPVGATRSVSRASHYLIQDPYHEYGRQFIDHLYRRYGLRAICFYTNRRERLLHETTLERLGPNRLAAAYELDAGSIIELLREVQSRYDIVAVIPFNETSLLPASEIASRLGLGWAQPGVIPLFRDKLALKQHLRATCPGLRVNASCQVRSSADILAARQQPCYRRFILKPNSGYGNRAIGLFDRESPEASLQAYLDRLDSAEIVMEEYIDGTEYFVNGQIDAKGAACTVAIFEYSRRFANGRHNIDFETMRIDHGTALFETLAGYAADVMRATGLKRSPFHLELKLDARGPCLIEVAARLPGNGNALLSGELHGGRLDLIDVASHFYLTSTDREIPLSWGAYNSQAVRYVHGIALRSERVYQLDGVEEVEALPEFHEWVRKPEIGARVQRTVDCLTMPWSLILKAPTELQVAVSAERVRRLVRWNWDIGSAKRAALSVRFMAPRALQRIRREILATLVN
jgi:ATP-grasp domain